MPAIVSVRNVPIVLEVRNSFCVLSSSIFKEKHRVVSISGMAVRLIHSGRRTAMLWTIRINWRRQNCRKSDGCREKLHVMPPVLTSAKAQAPRNKETQPKLDLFFQLGLPSSVARGRDNQNRGLHRILKFSWQGQRYEGKILQKIPLEPFVLASAH
jgi:hypothetical protein